MQGWWSPPCLPLTFLSGQCRRQMDVENDSQLSKNLTQVVTPIAAAVPDAVSLLEQINTSPGTLYAAIYLANDFFFVPVHKDNR